MPEIELNRFQQFIRKLGQLVADEIDKYVKTRTHKLKARNDALRKNLDSEKAKARGAGAELAGQVERARKAETQVKSLAEERNALQIELNALQIELNALREVHAKTAKEKSVADLRATKAEQALKAGPRRS